MNYFKKFYTEIEAIFNDQLAEPSLHYLATLFISYYPTWNWCRMGYYNGSLKTLTIGKCEAEFSRDDRVFTFRNGFVLVDSIKDKNVLIIKELATRMPHYSFSEDGHLEHHLSKKDSNLLTCGFFRTGTENRATSIAGIVEKYVDKAIVGDSPYTLG